MSSEPSQPHAGAKPKKKRSKKVDGDEPRERITWTDAMANDLILIIAERRLLKKIDTMGLRNTEHFQTILEDFIKIYPNVKITM